MKVPRFRIATLMTLVVLVAFTFAAIRAMLDGLPNELYLLGLGALPMANVLAVCLLIGYRGGGSRGFLLRFETFGAVALAVYIAAATMSPRVLMSRYLHMVTVPYIRVFVTKPPLTTFHSVLLHSIGVVMFVLPQLAFALIGGLLARNRRATERPDTIPGPGPSEPPGMPGSDMPVI